MNRQLWTIFCAIAYAIACTHGLEAPDGTFDAGNYFVGLNYPNFTLYAKFRNNSVYEEQYVQVNLMAVEEGTSNVDSTGAHFTATKSYSQMDLRSNYTVRRIVDTMQLSNGTILANREVLQVQSFLPNGANFTLQFEIYDQDGSLNLGTNIVSVKADRIKYTAQITNWTFDAPENQVRLSITAKYVSGPYDLAIPLLQQVGWDGPARHLVVSWPESGPLKETVLDADIWAVADGMVGNMLLDPNPTRDFAAISIGTEFPKYQAVTFGFILPRFADTLEWDPNVLMSLFSNDPSNPQSMSSSSRNFQRNRNIIIGCVVGGVVLAVVIIAVTAVLVKQHNSRRGRLNINHVAM